MKIFKMNDADWVAAATLDEAKKCLAEMFSDGNVTKDFEEEFIDQPHELDEAALTTLQFVDEEVEPSVKRSFKDELAARIGRGEEFPQHFASTEC